MYVLFNSAFSLLGVYPIDLHMYKMMSVPGVLVQNYLKWQKIENNTGLPIESCYINYGISTQHNTVQL